MLRFHTPLFKPDGRFSRIRLSDKESRFRPRKVARSLSEPDKSQLPIEIAVGESCHPSALDLVLTTQPLAKPGTGVVVHAPVGLAHGTQVEVVRPAHQHAVEPCDLLFRVEEQNPSIRPLTDLPAEPLNLL